jgi:hypothetical protein
VRGEALEFRAEVKIESKINASGLGQIASIAFVAYAGNW